MKNTLLILVLFFTTNSYGQLEKTFKSTKWNYTIQYPKEFSKSTITAGDPPITELHLADGSGRSIIITAQTFSSADATDLDKLTKEEMQSTFRQQFPTCTVFKFNRTTIAGRKGIVTAFTSTIGKTTVTNFLVSVYNGKCLIQITIGTFPETYKQEESKFMKIINSLKFI